MAHELFSLAPHALEQSTQLLEGVRQNATTVSYSQDCISPAIPFFIGELVGLFALRPLARMTGRIFGEKKEVN